MTTYHVEPVDDLIEHDTSGQEDCVCGPRSRPEKTDDGSVNWIVVHNSLDGRELSEEAR
ncbi:hypothetical protein AB0K87_02105 [Streptomyces sp. NPDC053705]|uniref:hypothetical protein n=1 Tax=Streptomyces TaxID=1883 RepID=UPI003440C8BD